MTKTREDSSPLSSLKTENERLRAENEYLRRQTAHGERLSGSSPVALHGLRLLSAGLFAVLAVILLVAGNVLFWFGDTIVSNDRFNKTVAPVVQNTEVQHAVASYVTSELYKNVDVTQSAQTALPSQAAFLAPAIASQLRGYTQTALEKILARPQFQERWNQLLGDAHAQFIATVRESGGDGVLDLNDLYVQLSDSLKGTSLSFLADKRLPPKVGAIQVASGNWIKMLRTVIVNIDVWRVLAVILFIVFVVFAVLLARRRRRMVVLLSSFAAVGMLGTLIALRLMRDSIAGNVTPQYATAVRETIQILLHPLVIQTALLLVVVVLVVLIAWLTGGSRSAQQVQGRVRLLIAGKLHTALFGGHENGVTRWFGAYKRGLQWTVLAVVTLLALFTRLTPIVLLWYVIALIVVELVIELVAASSSSGR